MNTLNKKKKIKNNFFFSIICPTVGSLKIRKLIFSLNKQKCKQFELIICDQSQSNKLKNIIDVLKKNITFKIRFHKTELGISKSRNEGIKYSKGNYLLFLDDDVTLPANFFSKLNKLLYDKKINILCFRAINMPEKKNLLNYPSTNKKLTKVEHIFYNISSISFVIKKYKKMFFNEKIGLGSKSIFWSGEETNLILYYFFKGEKIFFNKDLYLYHWLDINVNLFNQIKKTFFYGCGWSYVCLSNNIKKKFIFKNLTKNLISFFIFLIFLNFKKSLISISSLVGRVCGLILFQKSN